MSTDSAVVEVELCLQTCSDTESGGSLHGEIPEQFASGLSTSRIHLLGGSCGLSHSHGAKARKMSVIHLDNGGGGTLSGGGVIHGMCTELKILSRDHTILQWFFGTTTPPAAAAANAWFAYRVERRYAELPR